MADALQGQASQATDLAEELCAETAEELISETEAAAAIDRERANAVRETEQRLRREYEQKLETGRAQLTEALAAFGEQRNEYFARVEAEVVQLALSIAAKILHREAQVDSMLVAALVRIAIEKLREGSSVTVRVQPAMAAHWKQYLAAHSSTAHVLVAEDAQLSDQDCVVETELGSANFGLDTQLKEVEQGFFDLLALRPASR
jgi:flagellar assembly protein FliH